MVCPTCRRIYPEGVRTCTVDGAELLPEVGDFPTGFDDNIVDRTTPTPGLRQSQLQRQQPPTQKYPQQSRPSMEGDTNTPIGREGSAPRSLTDSNRHTPMGRELSTPRVVSNDLQISPGDLIADYQVTGRLGEGGMGTVYAGVQPVIGKQVAIKVLLREFASNAEVVNRFIQEARAANQARSRYIVDIFSFGELNDGRHYFVMEHLDGKSLREVVTEKKVVSFDEAYSILTCMAKGLMAAHGNGIIHRDIKPENIMVIEEEDGTLSAKLLDFGIAKLQGSMANPDFATKTGAAMGTPFYMSPEQCRGVDVDHRTDIYAVGIIMFEMFTGQLPFKASSYIELVNKHLFASPPEMRSLNPEISAQLEAFVQRCIAKNPDERPKTMKQFLSELKELVPSLHRTHPSAVQLMPVTGLAPGEASVPSVVTGAGVPTRKSRLWVVLLALALVVVGGGSVGAYLVWKKAQQPAVTPGDKISAPPIAADAGKPKTQTATLKVSTTPPGAAIFVNGEQIEQKSPAEVTVDAGKVQLRIVLDGYGVAEEQMEIEPGVVKAVSLTLTARPAGETGGLKLKTNVRRATFFLDGTIVHQGPTLELAKLEAKTYTLKITAPKREALEQGITILSGKTLTLSFTLKRQRRAGLTHTKTKTKKPNPKKGTSDDPDSTLNPFNRKK